MLAPSLRQGPGDGHVQFGQGGHVAVVQLHGVGLVACAVLHFENRAQAPGAGAGPNESTSIYQVAEAVGLIRNISAFDVLEVGTANFKRLFRL